MLTTETPTGSTNTTDLTEDEKRNFVNKYITKNYGYWQNLSKRYIKWNNPNNVNDYTDLLHITLLNSLKDIDKCYKLCINDKFKFYILQSLYLSGISKNSLYNLSIKRDIKHGIIPTDFSDIDNINLLDDSTDSNYYEIEQQEEQREFQINQIKFYLDQYSVENWHNVKIFKEYYYDNLNIRELSEKYHLSKTVIFEMIKKTKLYIKNNVKNSMN